mmetsp:Transcript_11223/g.39055  ORF Transcript_11223/g.39055 Transcript_11223/m.39055 type:complete len:714 (-) Transcript_11223:734-2875(-)
MHGRSLRILTCARASVRVGRQALAVAALSALSPASPLPQTTPAPRAARKTHHRPLDSDPARLRLVLGELHLRARAGAARAAAEGQCHRPPRGAQLPHDRVEVLERVHLVARDRHQDVALAHAVPPALPVRHAHHVRRDAAAAGREAQPQWPLVEGDREGAAGAVVVDGRRGARGARAVVGALARRVEARRGGAPRGRAVGADEGLEIRVELAVAAAARAAAALGAALRVVVAHAAVLALLVVRVCQRLALALREVVVAAPRAAGLDDDEDEEDGGVADAEVHGVGDVGVVGHAVHERRGAEERRREDGDELGHDARGDAEDEAAAADDGQRDRHRVEIDVRADLQLRHDGEDDGEVHGQDGAETEAEREGADLAQDGGEEDGADEAGAGRHAQVVPLVAVDDVHVRADDVAGRREQAGADDGDRDGEVAVADDALEQAEQADGAEDDGPLGGQRARGGAVGGNDAVGGRHDDASVAVHGRRRLQRAADVALPAERARVGLDDGEHARAAGDDDDLAVGDGRRRQRLRRVVRPHDFERRHVDRVHLVVLAREGDHVVRHEHRRRVDRVGARVQRRDVALAGRRHGIHAGDARAVVGRHDHAVVLHVHQRRRQEQLLVRAQPPDAAPGLGAAARRGRVAARVGVLAVAAARVVVRLDGVQVRVARAEEDRALVRRQRRAAVHGPERRADPGRLAVGGVEREERADAAAEVDGLAV